MTGDGPAGGRDVVVVALVVEAVAGRVVVDVDVLSEAGTVVVVVDDEVLDEDVLVEDDVDEVDEVDDDVLDDDVLVEDDVEEVDDDVRDDEVGVEGVVVTPAILAANTSALPPVALEVVLGKLVENVNPVRCTAPAASTARAAASSSAVPPK